MRALHDVEEEEKEGVSEEESCFQRKSGKEAPHSRNQRKRNFYNLFSLRARPCDAQALWLPFQQLAQNEAIVSGDVTDKTSRERASALMGECFSL